MEKKKEEKQVPQPNLNLGKTKENPLAKACRELIELKNSKSEIQGEILTQQNLIIKLMKESKMLSFTVGPYNFELEDKGISLVIRKDSVD